MASLLNLFHKDYMDFIYHEFGSDEKSKDDKMHFSDYSKAEICMNGLRDLIPKAIETNNLFFAQ
jgi:hypothetical protein